VKDAYYFSHDSNASNDPKIMAMINVYGMEGYGRWWRLVEMLREQSEYRLKLCKWQTHAFAMAWQCDANAADDFVTDCIDNFELLQTDGEHIWSNSLLRRMEIREETRQKRSAAGQKGAEKRWQNDKPIANAKQTHSTAIAKDSKERKGKETESKGNKDDSPPHVKIQHLTISTDEHTKLVDEYGEAAVANIYDRMRNYTKLQNYKSGYLTANNWLKTDKAKQPAKLQSTDTYDDPELVLRRMQRAAAGTGKRQD
jgi:hypothetical protein